MTEINITKFKSDIMVPSGQRATGENIFPDEIMNHTESEREGQRYAAKELHQALKSAVEAGESEFHIKDGYYRFLKTLEITDAKDIKIYGENVHFIQESRNCAVNLKNCKNIIFKGVTIDYDPVPWIQCTVIDYEAENEFLEVSVDMCYHNFFDSWLSGYKGDGNRLWFFENEANERQIKYSSNSGLLTGLTKTGDYTYSIQLDRGNPYLSKFKPDIIPGCRMVIPICQGGPAMYVNNCEGISVDDVTIYASPGFTITEYAGNGGNRYYKVRLIRRPETNRLIVSPSDGFHSIGVQNGALIDSCEFSYTTDDLFNAHGFLGVVNERIAANKYKIVFPLMQPVDTGAKAEFFDYRSLKLTAHANLVIVEKSISPQEKADAKVVREKLMQHTGAASYRSFDDPTVITVTLDRDIDIEPMSGICIYDHCQKGFTIRNSFLHEGFVRGILIRGYDALIENNIISRTNWSGVLIETCLYWLEGPFAQNIIINNNTFYETNISTEGIHQPGAVTIAPNANTGKVCDQSDILRNISVTGNLFINICAGAVCASNTKGLTVRYNKISGAFNSPKEEFFKYCGDSKDYYVISADHCEDVSIENNEITEIPGAPCRGLCRI